MPGVTKLWPTLGEFLDVGGDLAVGWPGVYRKALIEELFVDAQTTAPRHREQMVEWYQDWSKRSLAETNACRDRRNVLNEAQHFEECRRLAWTAEFLADPDLVARCIERLSHEERADGELHRDMALRPYPMRVDQRSYEWQCDSCGSFHDHEAAVVVGWREGYSELDGELQFCRNCIAMALAAHDARVR